MSRHASASAFHKSKTLNDKYVSKAKQPLSSSLLFLASIQHYCLHSPAAGNVKSAGLHANVNAGFNKGTIML